MDWDCHGMELVFHLPGTVADLNNQSRMAKVQPVFVSICITIEKANFCPRLFSFIDS